mmetsp:Transcript_1593/g.3419  ORF Transcript_1593/g.3419 Transcript_1593/m.3419 type:complete len:325 (-) Transcript_1593:1916-2890(-)
MGPVQLAVDRERALLGQLVVDGVVSLGKIESPPRVDAQLGLFDLGTAGVVPVGRLEFFHKVLRRILWGIRVKRRLGFQRLGSFSGECGFQKCFRHSTLLGHDAELVDTNAADLGALWSLWRGPDCVWSRWWWCHRTSVFHRDGARGIEHGLNSHVRHRVVGVVHDQKVRHVLVLVLVPSHEFLAILRLDLFRAHRNVRGGIGIGIGIGVGVGVGSTRDRFESHRTSGRRQQLILDLRNRLEVFRPQFHVDVVLEDRLFGLALHDEQKVVVGDVVLVATDVLHALGPHVAHFLLAGHVLAPHQVHNVLEGDVSLVVAVQPIKGQP